MPIEAPATEAPPPADSSDVDTLAARLVAALDDELRQRVDDWLRNGGDDDLEEALGRQGMPMQVAFVLISS